MEPIRANKSDRATLKEEAKRLGAFVTKPNPVAPDLSAIAPQMLPFVVRILEVLAHGDAVTIVPVTQTLTTQQAANLLNVSRQYLVRLLDDGAIPHTKTGRHRRILLDDILTYKRQRQRQRETSLQELTKLSEELGGYEDEV